MKQKLKVLLFSHYFYPSLGGIETVSLTLAEGFSANGIDCKVVTTTTQEEGKFAFEVVRNPSVKQQVNLVKWADVVLFNGASFALQPWVILMRKPFVWVHQSYIVSCIDGLGWVEGVKAPLSPLASIKYHAKRTGWLWATKEGVKLWVKRVIAKKIVDQNIAITKWVKNIQPLPRQKVIYNPFPINNFIAAKNIEPEYDFLYLGRLVSEKGVATLLKAFAKVLPRSNNELTLLLVGSGNWEDKMKALSVELGIENNVFFAGKRSGKELVEWVAKGKIAVIPSEWYEPMGGVCLELMAAGKSLIVSEKGGLKECVGDAGLTFQNGDDDDLANCMLQLLKDPALQEKKISEGLQQIKLFDPNVFVAEYITLLKDLVESTKK